MKNYDYLCFVSFDVTNTIFSVITDPLSCVCSKF
jgi:hypothetical protein